MGRNLTNLHISESFQYLMQVSGSENDINDGLGNDIDTLNVTASYATSASVADTVISASHAVQADNALTATSASFATTASFALNAGASTLQEVLDNNNEANADIILTGSYQRVSGSFSGTAIDNITDTYTSTEKIQHVVSLTQAEYDALTPDDNTFYVITDANATMITGSVSDATLTFTKDDASTFDLIVNNVANATSASYAQTASLALDLPSDTNLNINSITASNATFTSASIGYLQTITGSAKIIGDAFIILNNDTPTERYAGIVVQDSGSGSPLTTASLQFDGQTNDWFYEYSDDGGATVDHGVAMFGPEYSVKGSPTYPTANTLVKGNGGHHLEDSSITDDGTTVTVDANISLPTSGDNINIAGRTYSRTAITTNASGVDFTIQGGTVASTLTLQGNDTTAVNSIKLLNNDGIEISGSLNITGSTSVIGDVSASAFIGDGSQLTGISTDPFPYTGSAIITGSLEVTGSVTNEVYDIPVSSNTGSLDCSLGNMFQLALIGGQDVRLEASNVQTGQVINIRVFNDTTPGTISFDTSVFKFEGGTAFTATATAGAVDILTTSCFDNNAYLWTVGVKNFVI